MDSDIADEAAAVEGPVVVDGIAADAAVLAGEDTKNFLPRIWIGKATMRIVAFFSWHHLIWGCVRATAEAGSSFGLQPGTE